MMFRTPNTEEIELLRQARELLEVRHHPENHQVAAAARTSDGEIYLGLHIGSRRINVCAESSAIANAEMAGAPQITTMVAVCKNEAGEIVVTNPCGVCRELMGSYAEHADIMIDDRGAVRMVQAAALMPNRWMFPHENDWTPNDPTAQ